MCATAQNGRHRLRSLTGGCCRPPGGVRIPLPLRRKHSEKVSINVRTDRLRHAFSAYAITSSQSQIQCPAKLSGRSGKFGVCGASLAGAKRRCVGGNSATAWNHQHFWHRVRHVYQQCQPDQCQRGRVLYNGACAAADNHCRCDSYPLQYTNRGSSYGPRGTGFATGHLRDSRRSG